MKRINKLLSAFLLSGAVFFIACESEDMTDDPMIDVNEIAGKYDGIITLSTISGIGGNETTRTAVADVDNADDGQITVHCYSEGIDTTFILSVFEHNDSTMACLSGEAFESEYGHMMGQGHMMHGNTSGTSWMHHMEDEHQDSDDHFGGFDMIMKSFACDFEIMENDTLRNVHFNGTRK